MITLGQLIRQSRELKSLSQTKLADQLSVTRGAVSQWENNTSHPSHKNLLILANILDLDVSVLLNAASQDEQAKIPETRHKSTIKSEAGGGKHPTSASYTVSPGLFGGYDNTDYEKSYAEGYEKGYVKKYSELYDDDRKTVDKVIDSFWQKRRRRRK